MKKKLFILLGILGTIAIFGYTSVVGATTDTAVSLEWKLTDPQLEKIQLTGAEQDVDIQVEHSQNDYTEVRLDGKVSSSTARNLDKAKPESDRLILELSAINKVRVMATNEGKSQLKVVISLGKDADLDELKVESAIGNVKVQLPEEFEGKYEVDNKNMGDIHVPKSVESAEHLVAIKTMGNITVQ